MGTNTAHKREAEEIARKINAALALGTFAPDREREIPLPFDAQLRAWHRLYSPTFKPSYEVTARGHIENHLAPFFGSKDLRKIGEPDILDFIRQKLAASLTPSTILTALSIARRVFSLAHRDGLISRNPAARLGELMRRVDRATATEVAEVDAWTPAEVQTLLAVARDHERRFYPLLLFAFSTGARRGEILGLKWSDLDFGAGRVAIRRAFVSGALTTPKSGRGRTIAMTPGLADILTDLFATRRRQTLSGDWPEVPEWVFCSETGGLLEARNFERTWFRVRRRAQALGVRPFKFHAARHTYASLALASGKSLRWTADQLGHASPMLTLKTYAHAMKEEEADLSFADFGSPGRPYTAPVFDAAPEDDNGPELSARSRLDFLERETGFEPATLTLAT